MPKFSCPFKAKIFLIRAGILHALAISTDRLPLGDAGMSLNPHEEGGGVDEIVLGHKLFLKILIVISWIVVLSTKFQIM